MAYDDPKYTWSSELQHFHDRHNPARLKVFRMGNGLTAHLAYITGGAITIIATSNLQFKEKDAPFIGALARDLTTYCQENTAELAASMPNVFGARTYEFMLRWHRVHQPHAHVSAFPTHILYGIEPWWFYGKESISNCIFGNGYTSTVVTSMIISKLMQYGMRVPRKNALDLIAHAIAINVASAVYAPEIFALLGTPYPKLTDSERLRQRHTAHFHETTANRFYLLLKRVEFLQ